MRATGAGAKRIRVLIADDHVVVAEGLAFALSPYFSVVGMVHSLDRIVGALASTRPDVLVLDLSFNGFSALGVLKELTGNLSFRARVVVLTANDSRTLLEAARQAGALAALAKGVSTQELRLAIEAAATGRCASQTESRVDGITAAKPVRGRRSMIGGATLTDRQIQVLLMLSEGATRTAISGALGISIKGVDFLLRRVKDSTGLEELIQLVAWCIEYREEMLAAWERYLPPGTPN